MKFTFKTDKEKWDADFINVKYKSNEIGYFREDDVNRIYLQVLKSDINSDGNPNCVWDWKSISPKNRLETIDETKNWLNTNIEKLFEKYNIYLGR